MSASDHLSPVQFFHGTLARHGFQPGDLIEPGHDSNHPELSSSEHVYFTTHLGRARAWSSMAAGPDKSQIAVHQVEPLGGYERDPKSSTDAMRSASPLRVIRQVSREELGP